MRSRKNTARIGSYQNERNRGFTWENYDGSEIRVQKSVWRSHVDEPKRPKGHGAIPVIAQLKLLLDQHWERCGRPRKGYPIQAILVRIARAGTLARLMSSTPCLLFVVLNNPWRAGLRFVTSPRPRPTRTFNP